MPIVSQRKRALRGLREGIRAAALSENISFFFDVFDDDEMPSLEMPDLNDDMMMEFIEAYWFISRSRYLNKREPVPRAPDALDFWLQKLDEGRFVQDFRVTRFQFAQIVELIQGHPVFFNNSNVPQTPAWCQLLVALYRFGCDGNGVSIGKLACHFRCAEGTIEHFTDRCIVALVALEAEVVTWPDAREREEISFRIEEVSGFRQCLGFVDGTLFPFATKPELDGSDYYSRKGCYGMAGLVVCDDHK
ncbi:hypothetical protein L914_00399 [Phytophthora nicotianae]|uniref:DDE Tnp4 domain-containing protein n=2 Tax=Phytophthora nicotianae TaxID=4792 RepID=V9ELM4_PHYNI|nr:hypothetical protein F443_15019 [Phytophthora nicotianae P1569]ETM56664.1 hypothetical protein L914_00399 [Phytophthora nicotianae]